MLYVIGQYEYYRCKELFEHPQTVYGKARAELPSAMHIHCYLSLGSRSVEGSGDGCLPQQTGCYGTRADEVVFQNTSSGMFVRVA